MIPITKSGQIAPLTVSVIFIVVMTVAVSLRVYTKKLKNLPLEADDYLIFGATTFTYGLITCDMIGVIDGGVGLHGKEIVQLYGPDPLTIFLKDLVAIQMLWATSLALMKLSILFFYRSLFGSHPIFKQAATIISVIVAMWWLSVILCGFLMCRPLAFNWDRSIPDGHCGHQVESYIATGALNIITDVLVLVLPLPVVWKLHAPLGNRVALTAIFAVGFFVCVISILRMRSLLIVDYSDITFSVIDALIWSMLEPAVGITLACTPIIRPLFRIFRERGGASASPGNTEVSVPKQGKHDFHTLDEESGYRLNTLENNGAYTKSSVVHGVDEAQSFKTSQEELVPSDAEIRISSQWSVVKNQK